jgi:PTS system fructose-specific IIA component/PTS system nitrogen regulatory IIA component
VSEPLDGIAPLFDLPPEADSPEKVIRALVGELVRRGDVKAAAADEVVQQVLRRERLGTTAIGKGIAIPHSRSHLVDGAKVLVGRCPQPIDWPGSLDDTTVKVVTLLITPEGEPGAMLREMERLVRRLRDEPA